MSASTEHPVSLLAVGHWRAARAALRNQVALPSAFDAHTGARARQLAGYMADRALGRPERAWSGLGRIAASLARSEGTPLYYDLDGTALLRRPPLTADAGFDLVLARLIWREQQELLTLRNFVRQSENSARRSATLGMAEYLTWVEFDPWRGTFLDDPLGARVNACSAQPRAAVLAGASGLRHLSDPSCGDVSRSVWNDAGHYAGLRDLALIELAHRPRPPWVDAPNPHLAVPARTPAVLAWDCGRHRGNS